MEEAVIISKSSFEQLVSKIDGLIGEVRNLSTEVRKEDRLYNITETAKKLHISKPTLHKYIRLDLIEYKIVGNSTYFTQELIDKFISKKQ